MKGIELPINILVIIAVAVIVLLGVIALYFSGFMGPAGIMTQEAAKSKYCALIMRSPTGCSGGVLLNSITISDFDADADGFLGTADTSAIVWVWGTSTCGAAMAAWEDDLAALLQCYYGVTTESAGLKTCGCS